MHLPIFVKSIEQTNERIANYPFRATIDNSVTEQCAEIAVVSHYERNDLIDIKINAVRSNLFTTYSKAPADTKRVTFVIRDRYDND